MPKMVSVAWGFSWCRGQAKRNKEGSLVPGRVLRPGGTAAGSGGEDKTGQGVAISRIQDYRGQECRTPGR